VGALAQKDVGDYLNKHFVSSYQKVGTFTIAGTAKQGGNVASYFCTPDGHVLHIVAGPVNATQFLTEAFWVEETWKMADLQEAKDFQELQTVFRKAHLDRLTKEHSTPVNPLLLPLLEGKNTTTPITDALLKTYLGNPGDKQAKVHHLLLSHPLAKISRVYTYVFENILNENISTAPVVTKS
jgi:hypothetical protein